MYRKDKILCVIIFLLTVVLSYWFKAVINETLIQNLGTLFSILFGFYIAALSVLYGSAYSKRLYKKIDAEIPTQTQLHTLRRYFSASSTWAIISLVMIVMTSLLADNQVSGVLVPNLPLWEKSIFSHRLIFDAGVFWNSLVLAVTAMNFYLSFRLLKVLLMGFITEAKSNP